MKPINKKFALCFIPVLIFATILYIYISNELKLKNLSKEYSLTILDKNTIYDEKFYLNILNRLIDDKINILYEDVNGNLYSDSFSEWKSSTPENVDTNYDRVNWENAEFYILDLEGDGEIDIGFSIKYFDNTCVYTFNYDKNLDKLKLNVYGINIYVVGDGVVLKKYITQNSVKYSVVFSNIYNENIVELLFVMAYDKEDDIFKYSLNNVELTKVQWDKAMVKIEGMMKEKKYLTFTYEDVINIEKR